MDHTEAIPDLGHQIDVEGYRLTVEEVSSNRI
ncbi:MAG: hypothetical protein ACO3NA_04115 [Flavobacteriaceae bacterium]